MTRAPDPKDLEGFVFLPGTDIGGRVYEGAPCIVCHKPVDPGTGAPAMPPLPALHSACLATIKIPPSPMTSSPAVSSKTAAGVLAALLLGGGCGGPAVAPAPAAATSRLYVRGVPPEIVDALLYGGVPNERGPHELERWEGGPFRHCIAPGSELDPSIIAEAARIVSDATGIPERAEGSCNVTWEVRAHVPDAAAGALLKRAGGKAEGPIIGATIVIDSDDAFPLDLAVHELGHVLGLGHSPRPDDVMFRAYERFGAFSRDELAVIAAVYQRDRPFTPLGG